MSSEKTSWPELVGVPATPAVMTINSQRPDLTTEVLQIGISPSPPGVDSTRVCVYLDPRDKLGLVAAVPVVG
ncbi:hypothetical protein CFC21_000269 [Triticum aestivum]|uniref:Uncharacterized protein n=1 Tax=Triticum aestivum TaxID=4565 RepID=A0A3B5XTG5_WHEAT|nr:hypothetical protein CFC21_000265 [Triticum aestivum]KAF6981814.1 hypothetical protein CFC21_000268 [Triticum aestivum]KAF6981815.1 hypothetical protein CFC21_000269 [Triticum aestivum]